MSVAYVASDAVRLGAGTVSGSVNVPGVAGSGKLIMVCGANNTNSVFTLSGTGWTQVAATTGAFSAAIFEHPGDGTEPTSVTMSRTGTVSNAQGTIIRLTGAGTIAGSSMSQAATSTNVVLDSITGLAAGSYYLLQVPVRVVVGTSTYTPPATAVERVDNNTSAMPYAVGDETYTNPGPGTGSTGARTWVSTAASNYRGFMLAINPLAATGPTWTVYNGTSEVPATVTYYNGTTEVPVTTEITP